MRRLHTKILNALAEKPLTGVELAKKINPRWLWFLSPPYAALEFMERAKLITSYRDEKRIKGRGGSRRTYYALTRLGRSEFQSKSASQGRSQ